MEELCRHPLMEVGLCKCHVEEKEMKKVAEEVCIYHEAGEEVS